MNLGALVFRDVGNKPQVFSHPIGQALQAFLGQPLAVGTFLAGQGRLELLHLLLVRRVVFGDLSLFAFER